MCLALGEPPLPCITTMPTGSPCAPASDATAMSRTRKRALIGIFLLWRMRLTTGRQGRQGHKGKALLRAAKDAKAAKEKHYYGSPRPRRTQRIHSGASWADTSRRPVH